MAFEMDPLRCQDQWDYDYFFHICTSISTILLLLTSGRFSKRSFLTSFRIGSLAHPAIFLQADRPRAATAAETKSVPDQAKFASEFSKTHSKFPPGAPLKK